MSAVTEKLSALRICRIFEPANPVDPEIIFSELEARFRRPVPADYKSFVPDFGQFGFEQPVRCPLPTFPMGGAALLDLFFGLDRGHHYFLLAELESYGDGRMPEHLLPIAKDPSDNLFCLSLGSDDYGVVYYWDHEHVELSWERFDEMVDQLDEEGVDTSRLSIGQLILVWEQRHPEELGRPPGYGNLYRAAGSFTDFVLALVPFEWPKD